MAVILNNDELDSLANAVADRVLEILARRGLSLTIPASQSSGASVQSPSWLHEGSVQEDRSRRGRYVSEGMMNLASAVAYKLGKADPKNAEFNRVASEIAKLLSESKQIREDLAVHE